MNDKIWQKLAGEVNKELDQLLKELQNPKIFATTLILEYSASGPKIIAAFGSTRAIDFLTRTL